MNYCWEHAPRKSREKLVLRWKWGGEGALHVGSATFRSNGEWGWFDLRSTPLRVIKRNLRSKIWESFMGKWKKGSGVGYERRAKEVPNELSLVKKKEWCAIQKKCPFRLQISLPGRWLYLLWKNLMPDLFWSRDTTNCLKMTPLWCYLCPVLFLGRSSYNIEALIFVCVACKRVVFPIFCCFTSRPYSWLRAGLICFMGGPYTFTAGLIFVTDWP